ncbi:hypothetical protein BJ138DRAFT_1155327 [Hygrophoropsis aurantiaca]|uniref:Uncharacterized protein n=1 Tax=Hygrophoropsis aurantiaca TaxID=72124 RepID=A0ACB8A7G8_9AGAM|nr:hypothetical protein BJ138DRAFT_1155327 [Hygrophoropsis aurantiaca]
MFGESDSESPRVPSPWDSLTSVSPSPPRHTEVLNRGIPRLVPEAEEGNIEYKLQLLSPSPSRFTRLVTQMKWRLLEGGGQAYYELGVADSGMLVGLPQRELEESLETLEMMAGEIGASVIVVKEIEVPPELSNLAESQVDRWDGTERRREMLSITPEDVSSTELDTEFSTSTDFTDIEDETLASVEPTRSSKASHLRQAVSQVAHQPSYDSTLAIFTMDPESDSADHADSEFAPDSTTMSIDLEIAAVYKPRPVRRRVHPSSSLNHSVNHSDKRGKSKKHQRNFPIPASNASRVPDAPQSTDESNVDQPDAALAKQAQAQQRRLARDRRRDLKRNALLTHVATNRSNGPRKGIKNPASSPLTSTHLSDSLVSGLESLHVTMESVSLPDVSLISSVDCKLVVQPPEHERTVDAKRSIPVSTEPRLIVEVLVVRKMSLEEAFLDFGGFSLH